MTSTVQPKSVIDSPFSKSSEAPIAILLVLSLSPLRSKRPITTLSSPFISNRTVFLIKSQVQILLHSSPPCHIFSTSSCQIWHTKTMTKMIVLEDREHFLFLLLSAHGNFTWPIHRLFSPYPSTPGIRSLEG